MFEYAVQHTPIQHAREGDTQAKTYQPGDVIELTREEAKKLGNNVAPLPKIDRLDTPSTAQIPYNPQTKTAKRGKK